MKLLCEVMIPLLGVLLLVAAGRDWRRAAPPLLLSLGWVFLWQTLDRSFDLWSSFGSNYSSHTAVAIAVGTSLAFRGTRWLAISIVICGTYAAMMRHVGYHTVGHMVWTAAVVLPFCIAASVFIGRRETVRPTHAQD